MAFEETPPFVRGKTRWEGSPPNATDGSGFEGKEYWFPDKLWNDGAETKPERSNRMVKVRCVRNVSGGTLARGLIAKMKTDGTGYEFAGQVMGLCSVVGEYGYPIDEFLLTPVAANDLFYVVCEGPAEVLSDTAGDTTISIGDGIVVGAGTAGRVVGQDTSVAAGAATFAQINGFLGRAITAVAAVSTRFVIDVADR